MRVRYGSLSIPPAARNEIESAFAYLARDSVERSLIARLEHSRVPHRIVIDHRGRDEYLPWSHTIRWDPYSALRTSGGGRQSPALGLGHEIDHAAETGRAYDRLQGIPDRCYDSAEERRVILGSERHAAQHPAREHARRPHRPALLRRRTDAALTRARRGEAEERTCRRHRQTDANMTPLVIWGAGSTALIVADMIRLRDQYEIVGFLDSVNPERAGTTFCGAPVLEGEEQLDDLLQRGVGHVICAISIGRVRLRLTELARAKGFQLATVIHPQAIIASDVAIGAGTFIGRRRWSGPGSRLGENGSFPPAQAWIMSAPSQTGLGLMSVPIWAGGSLSSRQLPCNPDRSSAEDAASAPTPWWGAGSLVLADIPNGVLAYGRPAKVIRRLPVDDRCERVERAPQARQDRAARAYGESG